MACKGCDKGLGDTVHRAIGSIFGNTFKGCGGCKKRQKALNNLVNYNSINKALDRLKNG